MISPKPIRLLPTEVIARIAAGEAIERPASAVKELIENALDAGATEVSVDVDGGGLDLIRVADNGHGMSRWDLELAATRHATSKVTSADDMDRVASFGFRGEALASLAVVGTMTVISATEPDGRAWRVTYRDGADPPPSPASRRIGTTVTVGSLFSGLPSRRRFLGSSTGESGRIAQVVRRYAVVHAAVWFTLTIDARVVLQTTGSGRPDVAMGECWGGAVRTGLVLLPASSPPGIAIAGWIGDRLTTRPTRAGIVIAINGRPVIAARLVEAMEAAYRPLLPRGRHPWALVTVTCDPADVDPNVHPAKAEVLLRQEREVATALAESVRAALAGLPDRPDSSRWALAPGQPSLLDAPGVAGAARRLREPAAGYDASEDRLARARRVIADLPRMRLLGQVRHSVILLEGDDALYLVDQHRAHERVLYERLARTADPAPAQSLLEPLVLELKPHEAKQLASRLETLRTVGFQVEAVGNTTYLVHALPRLPGSGAVTTIDDEMAHEFLFPGDRWLDRVHTAVACRSALRRGEILTPQAMLQLLADLAEVGSPAVCPHGSPLILEVTGTFLERQFDWG